MSKFAESYDITDSKLTNNVLSNVLVCGYVSKNKRTYEESALKNAISLYDGAPVYINHSEAERKLEDRFGTLSNINITSKGLTGDIICLTTHPLFNTISEAYSRKFNGIGISHVIEGKGTVNDEGITVVSSIDSVRSCDIVTGAATTVNLRESELIIPEVVEQEVEEEVVVAVKWKLGQDMIDVLMGEGSEEEKLTKIKELLGVLTKVEDAVSADEQEHFSSAQKNVDWGIKPISIPLTESSNKSGIPSKPEDLAKWLSK